MDPDLFGTCFISQKITTVKSLSLQSIVDWLPQPSGGDAGVPSIARRDERRFLSTIMRFRDKATRLSIVGGWKPAKIEAVFTIDMSATTCSASIVVWKGAAGL